MYTYTDTGALVLNSYPPWPGACGPVTRWSLRADATETSCDRLVLWSTVTEDREEPMAYAAGRTFLLTPIGPR
jgi:hypothetical protein